LPQDCILKFFGGSLSNGTLVLNDTYVEGIKGFKSDLIVQGTVINPSITSDWFEMPIEDCCNQFRWIFGLSNASEKPVDITEGTYTIVTNDTVTNTDITNPGSPA